MEEKTFYDELVETTGSVETANKVLRLFDRTKDSIELTDTQKKVYLYLLSGKPILSLRNMSISLGFKNPQSLVAVLSALVIKGYLIPKGELDEPRDIERDDIYQEGEGEG